LETGENNWRMLALIFSVEFGWRAGVLELLAELALGLMLYGGGGGRRIRRGFRGLVARQRIRRPAAASI
jgi:hypothetical protein